MYDTHGPRIDANDAATTFMARFHDTPADGDIEAVRDAWAAEIAHAVTAMSGAQLNTPLVRIEHWRASQSVAIAGCVLRDWHYPGSLFDPFIYTETPPFDRIPRPALALVRSAVYAMRAAITVAYRMRGAWLFPAYAAEWEEALWSLHGELADVCNRFPAHAVTPWRPQPHDR